MGIGGGRRVRHQIGPVIRAIGRDFNLIARDRGAPRIRGRGPTQVDRRLPVCRGRERGRRAGGRGGTGGGIRGSGGRTGSHRIDRTHPVVPRGIGIQARMGIGGRGGLGIGDQIIPVIRAIGRDCPPGSP